MPNTSSRYAMIMAGGAGTRLWPMSRRDSPKQLLPLISGKSLLALAAERLEGIVPVERRLICTSEAFRGTIRAAMPEFSDEQILGEPEGRDTVNAVGFTAAVLARQDPDAIFAVLTADHVITPQDELQRRIDLGFTLIEDDPRRFVTFAIKPDHPATHYGYVNRSDPIEGFEGAFLAERFVEKPDLATARRYLDSGTYGWNSGMFVFHAATFLDVLSWCQPESHAGVMEIARAWGSPEQAEVLHRVYPTLPRVSVDFAVMEPASHDDRVQVCCVPMNVKWLDVGSWPSYGQTLETDANGNRSNARSLHIDSSNVLAVSDDPTHLFATIGCQDLIVIHTRDITLVCPASEAQRVKDMVGRAGEEHT